MSISFRLSPLFTSPPPKRQQTHPQGFFVSPPPQALFPKTPISSFSSLKKLTEYSLNQISAVNGNSEQVSSPSEKPRSWENVLSMAASLYPLYVTVGGVVACLKPSAFAWFVKAGPASYSVSLGLIMLAMGITLELKDFLGLFWERPLSILFGCVAQYTIMPSFAAIISKILGLLPSLSVGLILLGCCPGGTASNVVTLIAQGDVPLSIVMTMCTTLGAVLLTPLLTKILAGTCVPVDALKLSLSTLQVVVLPILLGSYLQSAFPGAVKLVTPFAPLFAVLASSLLACSVFSENVVRLKSSVVSGSLTLDMSLMHRVEALLTSQLGVVILSVLLLHFFGFFLGYISAATCGFKERQRRAISIEVGMQNSSLAKIYCIEKKLIIVKMENSNSNIMELRTDRRNKNIFDTKSRDRETQNDHSGKNGLRSANEMSQTVCLFRKYLPPRAQHNIGKTNMEESEVINKSPYRHLLPLKLGRNSLSRPPSLLERKLFPEVRCDSVKSTQDFCANKASASSQFTIFYAGQVNVYDNVSAEKAQEVMMILGGEQSLSKPVSKEVPKTDARSSPPEKSYSQSVLYKSKPGVPLARKYSLQCFIEKRRDRIISGSPYAVVASSPSNDADKEASIDTELSESRRPSLSPFPSRLGYFFPVSANKGC